MAEAFPVYYSVKSIAAHLDCCEKNGRARISDGELGGAGEIVMLPGGDLRIAWTGIKRFLDRCGMTNVQPRLVTDRGVEDRDIEPGIAARNRGELLRKVQCTQ